MPALPPDSVVLPRRRGALPGSASARSARRCFGSTWSNGSPARPRGAGRARAGGRRSAATSIGLQPPAVARLMRDLGFRRPGRGLGLARPRAAARRRAPASRSPRLRGARRVEALRCSGALSDTVLVAGADSAGRRRRASSAAGVDADRQQPPRRRGAGPAGQRRDRGGGAGGRARLRAHSDQRRPPGRQGRRRWPRRWPGPEGKSCSSAGRARARPGCGRWRERPPGRDPGGSWSSGARGAGLRSARRLLPLARRPGATS